jgi:double-stranded uracil-DNA glycosylase
MNELKFGFKQLNNPKATTLILGSMPSVSSLEASEYYAHPQNAFWWILAALTGVPGTAPYSKRLDALIETDIALWDVIAACERPGSLDSEIKTTSIRINDFEQFFKQHRNIQKVLLNGGKAYELFQRHVAKANLLPPGITTIKLPSTSPANARLSREAKKSIWLNCLSNDNASPDFLNA